MNSPAPGLRRPAQQGAVAHRGVERLLCHGPDALARRQVREARFRPRDRPRLRLRHGKFDAVFLRYPRREVPHGGFDPSEGLARSCPRRFWATRDVRFCTAEQFDASPRADLAFCNGVFHHIPVADREGAVEFVFESLRPGGFFAFWENNAWNPATRYLMSRVPFDRDALFAVPPRCAQAATGRRVREPIHRLPVRLPGRAGGSCARSRGGSRNCRSAASIWSWRRSPASQLPTAQPG